MKLHYTGPKLTISQHGVFFKNGKEDKYIYKLYYIHCIKAIKEIIHKYKIQEIDIDFSLRHWHILGSIAGNLEYGVKSIPTSIKVEPDREGTLVAKLFINPGC